MIDLIGLWSHALAALLYGALALWQLGRWKVNFRHRPLVIAFAVMSIWAIFHAITGPAHLGSSLSETAKNLAWLTFMYGIVHGGTGDSPQPAVKLVYGAVAAVIAMQAVLAFLLSQFPHHETLASAWASIGATTAAGSIVLVHNLYAHAARNSRWGIRLPVIALAAMWVYDLHLYTITYLTQNAFDDLFALRGVVAVMLVPLFAAATQRTPEWRVQLSRAAAFQSLSIVAIVGYFILMISATRMLEAFGGEWVRTAQIALIAATSAAALMLLPSARIRGWFRALMAKHLFEHRYDYREDWLRFTRTVASAGEDAGPIQERVVKALADIAGASSGLLLMVEDRRLAVSGSWNWPHEQRAGEAGPEFIRFLERSSFVLDFAAIGGGSLKKKGVDVAVPDWLSQNGDAWAGVPLVHNDRLVGIVLLGHPTPRRPMDWEDYDLFRTAGIQAASYLAEAQSQEALGHARRFDEFNRRFAFIMHDIKNLVSQLSLVTRNAERHADNPEFRADMVATLQSSVKKMNDLLARLSGGAAGGAHALQPLPLRPLLAAVAKGRRHPVLMDGCVDVAVLADPAGLEQALGHLVQNAIDANLGSEPVRIACSSQGSEVVIAITDSGVGMSPEFVRNQLFQPFASTKANGFGVGAFEARTLISAMGGRIKVESRQSEGSRFTIYLPAAEAEEALQPERMRA